LPAGTYSVKAQNSAASVESKTLQVSEATSATADDTLYAPVDAVDLNPVVQSNGNTGNQNLYTLSISGIFPKSEVGCMKLKELKVLPYEEVLVVLPVAEFVYDLTQCQAQNAMGSALRSSPFSRKFKAEKQIELNLTRDMLVHVRVLNGQSLNKVIEIER
jgi:hypothetical protein